MRLWKMLWGVSCCKTMRLNCAGSRNQILGKVRVKFSPYCSKWQNSH